MSHSYGNGNPNGNNYLNRKRPEDDVPSYYYDKYDKFDKYSNHSNPRYNNSMNYNYSKPPPKMNNIIQITPGITAATTTDQSHFITTVIRMVFPKNATTESLIKRFQLLVPLKEYVTYLIATCLLLLLYLSGKTLNLSN